jgi:hypothetical protein
MQTNTKTRLSRGYMSRSLWCTWHKYILASSFNFCPVLHGLCTPLLPAVLDIATPFPIPVSEIAFVIGCSRLQRCTIFAYDAWANHQWCKYSPCSIQCIVHDHHVTCFESDSNGSCNVQVMLVDNHRPHWCDRILVRGPAQYGRGYDFVYCACSSAC